MASSTTKTKTIRIANDTADFFEGKALNRLVECVHHLIESGKMTFDGEELKFSSQASVHICDKENEVDTTSDAFVDLKSMTDYFGITMDSLMEMFDVALNEGSVVLNDGKLVCVIPGWAEKLSDACHELGYDVEKIVDSAVKSLGKGML